MTDKPYDEYVDRVLSKYSFLITLAPEVLRSLLADAWLAGLAYSLDLIEEETKSPLRARLRDGPKKFEGGGKMQETIIWENCR